MIGENQGLCVFPLYIYNILQTITLNIIYYNIYIHTHRHITYIQYGFDFIYPCEKHEL